MKDQELYDAVAEELAGKIIIPGAMARAMTLSSDPDGIRSCYIAVRVAQLADERASRAGAVATQARREAIDHTRELAATAASWMWSVVKMMLGGLMILLAIIMAVGLFAMANDPTNQNKGQTMVAAVFFTVLFGGWAYALLRKDTPKT